MDDGRDLNPNLPDLSQNTATNAWGFAGDKLAHRFARANWQAGKQTPQAWYDAFNRLNQAALTPKNAANEILAVESLLPSLMAKGKGLTTAQAELSGIQLQLDWLGESAQNISEHAIITNHSKIDINGHIIFTVNNEQSLSIAVNVKAGEKTNIVIPQTLLDQGELVTAQLNYNWQGFALSQTMTQKTQQYHGYTLPHISAKYDKGSMALNAELHGPFAGTTKGMVTFDLYHGLEKMSHQDVIEIKPYEQKMLSHVFEIDEKSLEHDAWYEITIVAEVDGEPITLRKRLPYVPGKFNR
jgi:hypothetical protein